MPRKKKVVSHWRLEDEKRRRIQVSLYEKNHKHVTHFVTIARTWTQAREAAKSAYPGCTISSVKDL